MLTHMYVTIAIIYIRTIPANACMHAWIYIIVICVIYMHWFKVGPTYGRKMMTGLLSSQGINISQQRVGESLSRVSPAYQDARRTSTARQTNPAPYYADYVGHKIHIDQNEKLVMYGVTHVAAVDGFSGMIVGFITMPVKNNVEIYSNLYR